MAELKTRPQSDNAESFVKSLSDTQQREDSLYLLQVMKEISGQKPEIWTGGIIGFGRYTYQGKSCSGEWFPLGFSPRKNYISIYLMGYIDEENALLKKLGKFKMGKSCLNIKKLADIDTSVLEQILRQNQTKK